MRDDTIRFIYALKHDETGNSYMAAKSFQSQYTGVPVEDLLDWNTYEFTVMMFEDFLNSVERPGCMFRFFLELKGNNAAICDPHGIIVKETAAMLSVMCLTKIKEKMPDGTYKYINGFRDVD